MDGNPNLDAELSTLYTVKIRPLMDGNASSTA